MSPPFGVTENAEPSALRSEIKISPDVVVVPVSSNSTHALAGCAEANAATAVRVVSAESKMTPVAPGAHVFEVSAAENVDRAPDGMSEMNESTSSLMTYPPDVYAAFPVDP